MPWRLPAKGVRLVLRMPAQAFQIFDVGRPMRKGPGDRIARLAAQALNATALAFSQRPQSELGHNHEPNLAREMPVQCVFSEIKPNSKQTSGFNVSGGCDLRPPSARAITGPIQLNRQGLIQPSHAPI